MRISSLIFAMLVVAFSAAAPARPSEPLKRTIAAAMLGTDVPAMGVSVIRAGRIEASAVRGVRRRGYPPLVRPGDQWIIGSTAKVQTAAMIARLVEERVLAWDTPLAKLLPELASQMRPEYKPVTLRQLLSHHAGLPENISDMAYFVTFFSDKRPLAQQRLAYIGRALGEAPAYPPGTDFGYSNTGFLIAAAAAEKATGRSYEQLMRREVFGPLGMTSAGFGATSKDQPSGHDKGKPVAPTNPAMFAPAGNIHMSLGDWTRFALDQLAGAKGRGKLLTTETYRLMQSAQPNGAVGLDWGIQPAIMGRKGPVLVHGGSDGTWFAYVVLFPETGNGVLAIDNASEAMGGDRAARAALGAILPTIAEAK